MKLFGLEASRAEALGLASALGIQLASHEERPFEDGEFKIRPLEGVRGERVAIYQSCAGSVGMSANDKLMRALIFAGALKDAGAGEVVFVAPYLAYARKDRRTKPGDPVSMRYVAQMLEATGIDEVVTIDVHNPAAFENAFRCRTRNLEAATLFAEHFAALAGTAGKLTIVSPDVGGVKRARRLAELLANLTDRSVGLAFFEKHRSEGRVTGELFAGGVTDTDAIVVDDMICAGTTLSRAASKCLEQGARSVHAVATHGLFAPGASGALGPLALESVVVTDSVDAPWLRGEALADRLVVLQTAHLVANALR
jgi:ribose-phosphate pyrophosphokinase